MAQPQPQTQMVQCPTCPGKRRNDRPECKKCHDSNTTHPPGAPKKGPRPCTYAEKCTRFGCTFAHPFERVEPTDPALKPCKFAAGCTRFGCEKVHPPERVEPTDPATKPCKFAAECTRFGCKNVHPPERVEPTDPALKPCSTEAKYGFCDVHRNPTCLHRHLVSRVKK